MSDDIPVVVAIRPVFRDGEIYEPDSGDGDRSIEFDRRAEFEGGETSRRGKDWRGPVRLLVVIRLPECTFWGRLEETLICADGD
jgi:hypothetical protein